MRGDSDGIEPDRRTVSDSLGMPSVNYHQKIPPFLIQIGT